MSTATTIHASIVQRACDALVFHPECPPMDGTEGLAAAMEAALEAVRADFADDTLERARSWAVRLEQDDAEGRELAAALVLAFRTGESWEPTEQAVSALAAWVEAGDGVMA